MTERLTKNREFWDRSANWDVLRAIYDSEDVRDPESGKQAFDLAGVRDALLLAHCVDPTKPVVDLGCGIGRVMKPLASLCPEIIGVDISKEMLDQGKEYLEGVENARLVQTNGADLPGIADNSVGMLYSFLCLIHVDERTAYRYMREIERVLVPGGMALLQFENIMSEEGMREFQRVVDLDEEYPLEFYTIEELKQKFDSVGLEILTWSTAAQFLSVTVTKGKPGGHVALDQSSIEVSELSASGLFAEERISLGMEGTASALLRNRLSEPMRLLARCELSQELPSGGYESYFLAAGLVTLPPGKSCEFRMRYDGGSYSMKIELDGQSADFRQVLQGKAKGPGRAHLTQALIPPGFSATADFGQRFPHMVLGRTVEVLD